MTYLVVVVFASIMWHAIRSVEDEHHGSARAIRRRQRSMRADLRRVLGRR